MSRSPQTHVNLSPPKGVWLFAFTYVHIDIYCAYYKRIFPFRQWLEFIDSRGFYNMVEILSNIRAQILNIYVSIYIANRHTTNKFTDTNIFNRNTTYFYLVIYYKYRYFIYLIINDRVNVIVKKKKCQRYLIRNKLLLLNALCINERVPVTIFVYREHTEFCVQ